MELWTKKVDCSGCTACFSICPQKCITMKVDEEGFLYPFIDKESCVGCNACVKVCPIKSPAPKHDSDIAYVVRSKDETVLMNSSSGGCFSGIAQRILNREGFIVGALFDKDFSVIHAMSNSEKDIKKMRTSKYVQSRLEGVFFDIKEKLENGFLVCFVGTPCQVEGLRNFLKKDYDNLFLIDFVCHGVASPLVWQKYISYLEKTYNSKLVYYSFRDKHSGYHNFGTRAEFSDGSVYLRDDKTQEKDFMHLAYFNEICSRPSCHACAFKTIERCSDITLFDCWHVNDLIGISDDDKGYSTVMSHTQKGEDMLKQLRKDYFFAKVDISKAIELDGGNALFSMVPHPKRRDFFIDINEKEIPEIAKKYFKEKNRILKAIRLFVVKGMKNLGIFSYMRTKYYSLTKKRFVNQQKE